MNAEQELKVINQLLKKLENDNPFFQDILKKYIGIRTSFASELMASLTISIARIQRVANGKETLNPIIERTALGIIKRRLLRLKRILENVVRIKAQQK